MGSFYKKALGFGALGAAAGAVAYYLKKQKEKDPQLWCATRQVDKLNNENFFLPRYSLCTGLFMQRFLVFVHGIPVV